MWQEEQAVLLNGEMFLSKFMSLPSISTEATPVSLSMGGLPVGTRGFIACHCRTASASIKFTSRSTLANSEFISVGRIPGGYGLYIDGEGADASWADTLRPANDM